MSLKVYYGFTRLNKVFKKRSLKIIFENERDRSGRNLKRVQSWIKIVYIRNQSQKEEKDAELYNRVFTVYELFIDEKPWNGNIEALLEHNFKADYNHVSIEVRTELKDKLYMDYRFHYNNTDIGPQKITKTSIVKELSVFGSEYNRLYKLEKPNDYHIILKLTTDDKFYNEMLLNVLKKSFSIGEIENNCFRISHLMKKLAV